MPCDLPMIDVGSFGATQIRNGTQYFARIDQGFKNERIYVSLFRTLLQTGAASPIPQFSALNNTWQVAGQVAWTHTFSLNTLNEVTAGQSRVEGVLGSGAKDYTVPSISVNGINADGGQAYGVGFAQGDFIQHNYHWRDVLTHVRGTHTLKFGYEGWYGDDVEPFQGPWSSSVCLRQSAETCPGCAHQRKRHHVQPGDRHSVLCGTGRCRPDVRFVRGRHLEGERRT